MNESERPSVEGLRLRFFRDLAGTERFKVLRVFGAMPEGVTQDEMNHSIERRLFDPIAERLTLSAQPVATIVEMSDEQILEICKQSDMNEPNSRKRFGYLLAEGVVIGDFQETLIRNVRAVLAASRLDGANAGEKP